MVDTVSPIDNARILADSLNTATGDRVTTFLLPRFPYCLIQEQSVHRVIYGSHSDEPLLITDSTRKFDRDFSMSAGSTRAIPIKRVITALREDPYIPDWTRNQKGQVGINDFTQEEKDRFTAEWLEEMELAISYAQWRHEQGIAKQDANRALIPWLRIPVILTATDYSNFFELRTASNVQPAFREVALEMQHLYAESIPDELDPGEWHIPLLRTKDVLSLSLIDSIKVAAARCARGSLANHLGQFDYEADFDLHDMLVSQKHSNPLEHQCKALPMNVRCRNLSGFMSYRVHVEDAIPILTLSPQT